MLNIFIYMPRRKESGKLDFSELLNCCYMGLF